MRLLIFLIVVPSFAHLATGAEPGQSAALKPIHGKLAVDSVPPGAEVFLGNQSLGRTPLVRVDMDPFVDGVIEVRLRGHRPERQRLSWRGQRTAKLVFTLRPGKY